MSQATHHIGRMVVDLELDSASTGEKLQQAYPEVFGGNFESALERVCDRIAGDDEWIVIDKLELDLGNVKLENLQGSIEGSLLQALSNQKTHFQNFISGSQNFSIASSTLWTEVLILYLQSGNFPWWLGDVTCTDLEIRLPSEFTMWQPVVKSRFFNSLSRPKVWRRFNYQFSMEFRKQLMVNLFPEISFFIFNEADDFARFLSGISMRVTLTDELWQKIFLLMLINRGKDKASTEIIMKAEIFRHACLQNGIEPKEAIGKLPQKLKARIWQQFSSGFLAKQTEKKDQSIEDQQDEPFRSDEYNIPNCGLVILWPYLPQLFGNLKLLQQDDFIDDERRNRAVLLMQYLATGVAGGNENDLIINKILCGCPIDEPVRRSIELSDEEVCILNEFLEAFIKNWSALKKTSNESLRETFILRNGFLKTTNGNFSLKVERKGVDILRDMLPWNISVIKLPWMNQILFVEW